MLFWFFVIPAIATVVGVVLVLLFAWSLVVERRHREEAATPPQVSDDGHFYWTGSKWKPLR